MLPLPKITQNLIEILLNKSPNSWKFLLQREHDKPPYNQNSYNIFLKERCEKLNLPIITSHNLRHSITSLLLLEHNDEIAIQRYLGHAKIEFTKNHYGHHFNDGLTNITKVIDDKLIINS